MDRPTAIFITGASSGIGKATALELARPGTSLYFVARREDPIDALAQECIRRGAEAHFRAVDLTVPVQLDKVCEDFAVKNLEAKLAVINAAGNLGVGSYHDMHWHNVQEMMDLLLIAPMRICHRLIGPMREQGGGRIVNVLSIAAQHTFFGLSAYSTAKAGLRKFGETLNVEYRKFGIHCTSLTVGATDTAIWDSLELAPERRDMLTPKAIGENIRDLIYLPADRTVDEIVLMPPKGIL